MNKKIKLKQLLDENFSLVGGLVTTPVINKDSISLSGIVKEKYGDAEPKYKSKLERVMELPQYKYENWAQDQKWSDVTKQKNPNYKPPPKKFFEHLLPLPPIKKVKFEPLKYEYLPMEFDVEPIKAKKEIKRPKAEGIVSVLNLDKLG